MAAAKDNIRAPGKLKLVKWKVRKESHVYKGTVLALYNELEESKGASIPKKLKATGAGVVADIPVKEGEVANAGDILLRMRSQNESVCSHPTIMKDMCAECGMDLRESLGLPGDRKTSGTASVAMVHSIPELIVSQDIAMDIGKEDENRLLRQRKLVLLVDLDQTLIHTTNDNIPPNLKDVKHFQLWHGKGYMWYHTRFRPFTLRFIEAVSKMYELHICTFGVRMYAHVIARMLDPDEKYFSHRILSRDECFDAMSKTANLKALFPCGDKTVCIIDDREDVWNFAPNLVHVKPYRFFQGTADINAPPGMAKKEHDNEPLSHKVLEHSEDKSNAACGKVLSGDGGPGQEGGEARSGGSTKVEDMDTAGGGEGRVGKLSSGDTMEVSLSTEESLVGKLAKGDTMEMSLARGDTMEVSLSTEEGLGGKLAKGDTMEMSLASGDTMEMSLGDREGLVGKLTSGGTMEMSLADRERLVGRLTGGNTVQMSSVESSTSGEGPARKLTGAETMDMSLASGESLVGKLTRGDTVQMSSMETVTGGEGPADQALPHLKDSGTEAKSTKSQEKAEKGEASVSTDKGKGEVYSTKKGDNPDQQEEEVDWEDTDDYLLHLEEILTRVHTAYYDMYEQGQREGAAELPDLKSIIPYVRRKVLKGANVVFSGMVPLNMPLEKSRAYAVATSLGASVQTDIVPVRTRDEKDPDATTHLVAAKSGTGKHKSAMKVRGLRVVSGDWLWACTERWEWVDEGLYPLPNSQASSGKNEGSPDERDTPSSKKHNRKRKQGKRDTDALSTEDDEEGDSVSDEAAAKRLKLQSSEEGQCGSSSGQSSEHEARINPLYSFTDEDLETMDKEVEDFLEDEEVSSDEADDDRDKRMRTSVLGSGDDQSDSDSDSLSGDFPRGWKMRRKSFPSPDAKDGSPKREEQSDAEDDDETENELERYEKNISTFVPDESSSAASDDSIGSVDDEIADAVEKEFLS